MRSRSGPKSTQRFLVDDARGRPYTNCQRYGLTHSFWTRGGTEPMGRSRHLQRARNLFAVVALALPSLAAASPASPSSAKPGAPELRPAAAGADHRKALAPQAGELLPSVLGSLGQQPQPQASPL